MIRSLGVKSLPETSLLADYVGQGSYVDCFYVDVARPVSLAAYIEAFYSSAAFRLERFLLGALLAMPSNAQDIAALANCETQRFAAWSVEARTGDELLLRDYREVTRSWLKVEQRGKGATRLYFGTAVVLSRQADWQKAAGRALFHALLWFHKPYARLLLRGAASGCAAYPRSASK